MDTQIRLMMTGAVPCTFTSPLTGETVTGLMPVMVVVVETIQPQNVDSWTSRDPHASERPHLRLVWSDGRRVDRGSTARQRRTR